MATSTPGRASSLTARRMSVAIRMVIGVEIEAVLRPARRIVDVRGRDFGLSPEDREDVLQEVLAKYVRTWSADAEPDNVEAWLETATGRLITDRWRAEQRRPLVAEVEDRDGDPYDVVADFMERARSRQPSMPAVGDAVINRSSGSSRLRTPPCCSGGSSMTSTRPTLPTSSGSAARRWTSGCHAPRPA